MDIVHPIHGVVLEKIAHIAGFAPEIVDSGRSMEDIRTVFDVFDKLQRFGETHLFRVQLVGGYAVFHNEVFAHRGADGV